MKTVEPRIQRIFNAAMDVSCPQERSILVDQLCAPNLKLAEEVHELIDAMDRAVDFLENLDPQDSLPIDPPTIYDASAELTQLPHLNSNGLNSRMEAEIPFRKFGNYELIEVIAQGGMGVVYKARQTGLNRIVALKMILTGAFADDEEIKRFYQEAEAAAKLDHPGIVPVYEVGCCAGQHYYSMALVEGKSLASRIKESQLEPRESAEILLKIARAVHVAHEAGFIHRDLKPANILLDGKNEPRIVDFGLAKSSRDDSDLTRTGTVMGTPNYMPPEQATGKNKEVTNASDVYSLGAILYTLLTGQPPFVASNSTETLMQVLQDDPLRPRYVKTGIPVDLEAICAKCMEKKPADRYSSAEDLASDLERFLNGTPIHAKNDWKRRVKKWVAREPVLAAHLVLVPILAVAVFFATVLSERASAVVDLSDRFGWSTQFMTNIYVLLSWGAVAIILQKIHNRFRSESFIPTIWAGIDPIFLAGLLCLNNSPRGLLLSSFPLLILIISLFRRVDLISVATVSSLVGFGLVVIFESLIFQDSSHKFDESLGYASYNLIFSVCVVLTGIVSGFQAHRLNKYARTH
ncbi:MAG: serine/threonine protein kinase [Planctomycetaceae bacterium]|nr:serine/threonine protein kinase [Planctomycetaceae bacterium]